MMRAETLRQRPALRGLVVGLGIALAWVVGAIGLQRNLQRACELREWPDFSSCPVRDEAVPAQVRDLRARIAANPGDSAAWLALALLTSQPGGVAPLDDAAVLATASRMAPQDPLLQRLQVSRALQRELWPQAVPGLVRLVQEQGDADAARVLAALVARPNAQAALRAALQPGSTWLEPMLGQLDAARVPVVLAMPLVAQALPLKLISARMGQALMRSLKAGGQWLEAQALWVALVGGAVPLLYNGGFEQGFIADGFDWELRDEGPSKAGALIEQPALGERGRVLQVEFTGRPMAQPLVRQTLVLPPGSYGFAGDYMGRQMRTEQGLVWIFNCVAGGRELARTPALLDTQGQWRSMSVALAVPPDCTAVVLQLQTGLGSEALTGLRGQMSFDAFRLEAR
ncbi:MAG: hypothetical protein IPG16_14000 [Comamonadaceae bacterium]|nr:hypothetical protein [Comamonadaceae bacterium]